MGMSDSTCMSSAPGARMPTLKANPVHVMQTDAAMSTQTQESAAALLDTRASI